MADKAFIFDMDGVIIDSEQIHARAKSRVLKEYGVDLGDEQYWFDMYVGRSADVFFADVAKKFPEKNLNWQEMVARKHVVYREILAADPDLDAIKGVRELLARLKEHGYKLAVGSSGRTGIIIMVLKRFGITDSNFAV